jgi:hypothetical protein
MSGFPPPGRLSEQTSTSNPALAATWNDVMMRTETAAEPCNAMLTSRLVAVCSDPRNHCALVPAANVGLACCAAAEPFTPALVLHFALVPFNAWRLVRALRAGPPARRLPQGPIRTPVPSSRPKATTMRYPAFDARNAIPTIRLTVRH